MYEKRFKKQELNPKDYRTIEILVKIARVILTPIFLILRIYYWIWDYDWESKFYKPYKHN